jgi:hypothetical protein
MSGGGWVFFSRMSRGSAEWRPHTAAPGDASALVGTPVAFRQKKPYRDDATRLGRSAADKADIVRGALDLPMLTTLALERTVAASED